MSAGDFATARRGGITLHDLGYARAAMLAGHGFQAAAAMIGCSEITLRERLPDPRKPRPPLPFRVSPAIYSVIDAAPPPPVIRDVIRLGASGPVMARDIISIVCGHYDIPLETMTGPHRFRKIARPRQRACFLIREYRPNVSYPEIGRLMGGRDHTTVLHAVRKVEELIAASPEEAAELDALRTIIDARSADGVAG